MANARFLSAIILLVIVIALALVVYFSIPANSASEEKKEGVIQNDSLGAIECVAVKCAAGKEAYNGICETLSLGLQVKSTKRIKSDENSSKFDSWECCFLVTENVPPQIYRATAKCR